MKYLLVYIQNKKYYIGLLDKQISNSDLQSLYGFCFKDSIQINELEQFVLNRGVNIIICDLNYKPIFLVSFVHNDDTGFTEMYNVCKTGQDKSLSSSHILTYLIKYFVTDNPQFYQPPKVLLSLYIDNDFLIPALFCYQNIGFRYQKPYYPQLIEIYKPFIQITFYSTQQIKSNRIDDTMLILKDLFKTNRSLQEFYTRLTKKQVDDLTPNILKSKIKEYLVKSFN